MSDEAKLLALFDAARDFGMADLSIFEKDVPGAVSGVERWAAANDLKCEHRSGGEGATWYSVVSVELSTRRRIDVYRKAPR